MWLMLLNIETRSCGKMSCTPCNNIGLWHCAHPEECGEILCDICGDYHEPDNTPISCETGDGLG